MSDDPFLWGLLLCVGLVVAGCFLPRILWSISRWRYTRKHGHPPHWGRKMPPWEGGMGSDW